MGPTLGHAGVQRHAVHQFGDPLLFFRAPGRQPEADVGSDGHVREQGTILGNIANQSLVRRHLMGAVDQRLSIEQKATRIGEFEAGDHAQQGGLART
ncbi:hypothetical protein D3C84_915640 [compost metagenome]